MANDERCVLITVGAIVESGKGTLGTKCEQPEDKRAEIHRLTGIDPVPGSLNVRSVERVWFRRRTGRRYRDVLLYPAWMGDVQVAVGKRGGFGASPHLLHVYAGVRLREELDLSDGDVVKVALPRDALVRWAWVPEMVWRLRLLRRGQAHPESVSTMRRPSSPRSS